MKTSDTEQIQPMSTATVKPGSTAAGAPQADGRLQRSIVTRKKIVDALTALVYEGHVSPTAQQVAERAAIGLRTVFRHFDDMDSLYREINRDVEALVQPLLSLRLNGSTWQERLLQSIDIRAELYDRLAAVYVASQVHRHESAYLAQKLMDSAQQQRDLLIRLLPTAVARNATLLDALDLTLSFEAWTRLRREQGLEAAQASEVIRLAVRALLADAEP